MDQLELTALAVKKKVITSEKGSQMVWETIYTQRKRFSLGSMDYDSFMDFLEYIQPKFITILNAYNPHEGSFYSFLYAHIKGRLQTWKKNISRKIAADDTYLTVQEIEYDNQTKMYEECEKSFTSCNPSQSHTLEEVRRTKEQSIISMLSGNKQHRISLSALKEEKLRKEAILILTLKSCCQVTEDIISKVSVLTDMNEIDLRDLIEKAKESISAKIQRRNIYIRARDNAFFFHRKYMLESRRITEKTNWAVNLASRYERQTRIWKEANTRLNRKYCALVPSTKTVAELLEMTPRHCEYVLKKISSDMDKIKLKWYSPVHENISCNRKP